MDVCNDHSRLPSTGRPNVCRYKVFLSFKGRDVWRGFVKFLYQSLADSGIRAFGDPDDIEIGENTMDQIIRVIRLSEICIPIFSRDFASSKYCLTQVAEMVECKRTIVPVYYDISPEVVREEQDSYQQSFRDHEAQGVESTTINKWKKAVHSVSLRSGWYRSKVSDGDSELIEQVVSEVCRFLRENHLNRSFGRWQKGVWLGRGSHGNVYKGFTDDGLSFVVKEVPFSDIGNQECLLQLEQKISLLHQFEHPNIVRYLGIDKDSERLYIFLEFMTEGSLATLCRKYNLSDSQVSACTRQILNGLKYLHDRNVIHSNIKCANILFGVNGSVKLADFGLAKIFAKNNANSPEGTCFWMAPEVVNTDGNYGLAADTDENYGLAADIWSLGCTVLEMLTKQHPYHDLQPVQALLRIGMGKKPPSVPDSLSKDAQSFILECLQVNPDSRPSAAQLLNHSYVRTTPTSSGSSSFCFNNICS